MSDYKNLIDKKGKKWYSLYKINKFWKEGIFMSNKKITKIILVLLIIILLISIIFIRKKGNNYNFFIKKCKEHYGFFK